MEHLNNTETFKRVVAMLSDNAGHYTDAVTRQETQAKEFLFIRRANGDRFVCPMKQAYPGKYHQSLNPIIIRNNPDDSSVLVESPVSMGIVATRADTIGEVAYSMEIARATAHSPIEVIAYAQLTETDAGTILVVSNMYR